MRREHFVAGFEMQLRLTRSVPFNYVPAMAQPAAYLMLSRGAHTLGQPESAARLILSVGLLAVWGTTIWTCGLMLRWDAGTGVLSQVLTMPVAPWLVLLGRGLGAGCFGVLAIGASLTVTV